MGIVGHSCALISSDADTIEALEADLREMGFVDGDGFGPNYRAGNGLPLWAKVCRHSEGVLFLTTGAYYESPGFGAIRHLFETHRPAEAICLSGFDDGRPDEGELYVHGMRVIAGVEVPSLEDLQPEAPSNGTTGDQAPRAEAERYYQAAAEYMLAKASSPGLN